MQLGNYYISPGEHQVVPFFVGKLPSSNKIHMRAHVFRGSEEGPCLLITAGVHGDEVNGVAILRQCLDEGLFQSVKRGSVIVIPVVNVYGFINFSRAVPDGKDVNRSFPGSSRGSLASRVAYIISKKILPSIDIGLDLHTGGSSRYNLPQVRISKRSEKSLELAKVFGSEVILKKSMISKSLRKVAHDRGKPIIVYEGGESTRINGKAIECGKRGIFRVLSHLGMIDMGHAPQDQDHEGQVEAPIYERTLWIRAKDSGLFVWEKSSGDTVVPNECIGYILDPYDTARVPVRSSKNGLIIGHNNAPVVYVGDALFHIAYEK